MRTRTRSRRLWIGVAVVAGVALLALPAVPSLRRYVRLEMM